MKEGTKQEEAKESPKKEKAESSNEVPIPEEFQKKVKALVDECNNEECLDYMRSCLSKKSSELHKEKMKESDTKIPSEYSTAEMPS